jgi:hypothetical protein
MNDDSKDNDLKPEPSSEPESRPESRAEVSEAAQNLLRRLVAAKAKRKWRWTV